jgi:hypothetical protein
MVDYCPKKKGENLLGDLGLLYVYDTVHPNVDCAEVMVCARLAECEGVCAAACL